MVQKEVAERITSKHNNKNYGVLTVCVNSIADTNITRIVKRNMFYPVPNVDSAVLHIKINKNKYKILNYSFFENIVECAFNFRRKLLFSNLKNNFNIDETALNTVFDKLCISKLSRAENLTVDEFVNMSNEIYLLQK